MLHWVQIKLSASMPTCPEGVTTHTVLSYEQTPLHAAGFQWLPKAREERGAGREPEEKMWDGEMQREGEGKEKEGKRKVGMGARKRRSKRKDERVGGRWQEGSMQIAQDLTGIFLDG